MKRVISIVAYLIATGCGPVPTKTPKEPAPASQVLCTPLVTSSISVDGAVMFPARSHWVLAYRGCTFNREKLLDVAGKCTFQLCGSPIDKGQIAGLLEKLAGTQADMVTRSGVPIDVRRLGPEETVLVWDRTIAPEKILGGWPPQMRVQTSGTATPGVVVPCFDFAPCLPGQCEGGPVPVPRLEAEIEPCDCEAVCDAKARGQVPADCQCAQQCKCS